MVHRLRLTSVRSHFRVQATLDQAGFKGSFT